MKRCKLREYVSVINLPVFLVVAFLSYKSHGVDFVQDIEPILQAHCIDCHGPDEQESQFRLDRLANMISGGNSGEPAIVQGKPEESFLLKLIRHEEPGKEMPPNESLSEGEIQLIEQWIAGGAKTPDRYGPAKADIELSHWAFRPVKRFQSAGIDELVRNKLTDNGLAQSPAAERRVLIRRLYLVMLRFSAPLFFPRTSNVSCGLRRLSAAHPRRCKLIQRFCVVFLKQN